MALCSRMKTVVISSRPSHQPSAPPDCPSSAGSRSMSPSSPMRTLPSLPVRTACWNSGVLP